MDLYPKRGYHSTTIKARMAQLLLDSLENINIFYRVLLYQSLEDIQFDNKEKYIDYLEEQFVNSLDVLSEKAILTLIKAHKNKRTKGFPIILDKINEMMNLTLEYSPESSKPEFVKEFIIASGENPVRFFPPKKTLELAGSFLAERSEDLSVNLHKLAQSMLNMNMEHEEFNETIFNSLGTYMKMYNSKLNGLIALGKIFNHSDSYFEKVFRL